MSAEAPKAAVEDLIAKVGGGAAAARIISASAACSSQELPL